MQYGHSTINEFKNERMSRSVNGQGYRSGVSGWVRGLKGMQGVYKGGYI